jgi:hypothetical protein
MMGTGKSDCIHLNMFSYWFPMGFQPWRCKRRALTTELHRTDYTLHGVSIHPVTTTTTHFTMSPKVTLKQFKTVTEFNGCDRTKQMMDIQHCSNSTIRT